jgi:hypothetical protein
MRIAGAMYLICAAVVIMLLGSSGCAPTLTAQSAAPPGRAARLDEVRGFWGDVKSYRIELSKGVALALTCNRGGPCEKLAVVSDDPAVAEVRAASLSALERNGFTATATASGLVVVGKQPGKTVLRLRTKNGSRAIAVTVIAPPSPTPHATVAN